MKLLFLWLTLFSTVGSGVSEIPWNPPNIPPPKKKNTSEIPWKKTIELRISLVVTHHLEVLSDLGHPLHGETLVVLVELLE